MLAALSFSLSSFLLTAVGVLFCALVLPIAAIVVIVMLWRRTSAAPPPAAPSSPLDFLNTPAELGIFNGLFAAIRANDRQKMLIEIEILARRAGEAGGAEAMLESWLYSQLERKLANPSSRTPVLSALARVLHVSERQLLDVLEGKTAAASVSMPVMTQPVMTQPVMPQATAVVAKLIVLALLLAGGSALAAPPLRSPERFDPPEVAPVIDPPTFRQPQAGQLAPNLNQVALRPLPRTYGTYYYTQPARYWRPAAAPFRLFGRWCRGCR